MISFILTMKRLITAVVKAFKEPVFLSLVTTLALIVLSGTLFYRSVEGWETIDAIYFAFVSLIPTGIETGLSPVTDFGKIFTMIYLVVGVGVMLMMLLTIGTAVVDFEKTEKSESRQKRSFRKGNKEG